MTLSSRSVQRVLRRDFVCGWVNLEGDPAAGASFAHDPKDPPGHCFRGAGEHNVQLMMLTPEGRLLNVVAGYIAPDELVEELGFALGLLHRVEGSQPDAARRAVTAAHRARLEKLGERELRGVFAEFIRKRLTADHRFVARHPLRPIEKFRAKDLVGSGRSFFGSVQGTNPHGKIGDRATLDSVERSERRRPASRPARHRL